jgi:hypothetical protein
MNLFLYLPAMKSVTLSEHRLLLVLTCAIFENVTENKCFCHQLELQAYYLLLSRNVNYKLRGKYIKNAFVL